MGAGQAAAGENPGQRREHREVHRGDSLHVRPLRLPRLAPQHRERGGAGPGEPADQTDPGPNRGSQEEDWRGGSCVVV